MDQTHCCPGAHRGQWLHDRPALLRRGLRARRGIPANTLRGEQHRGGQREGGACQRGDHREAR